jgi:hypothetical protein
VTATTTISRAQRRAQRLIQSALSAAVFALIAMLAGGVIGFVYAHEPARDTLVIAVEAPASPDTTTVGGTIASIAGGRIVIEAQAGPVELALPSGTPLEQLVPMTPDALAPGAQVNIGAERNETSTLLTGVVVVSGQP